MTAQNFQLLENDRATAPARGDCHGTNGRGEVDDTPLSGGRLARRYFRTATPSPSPPRHRHCGFSAAARVELEAVAGEALDLPVAQAGVHHQQVEKPPV